MHGALAALLLTCCAALASDVPLKDLETAGSAGMQGSALRLTPAKVHQAGAAWLRQKQALGGGFDTTFRFRLSRRGGLGGGADGFAFVLQNSGPAALGGKGSGGGFALGDDVSGGELKATIPRSIAVFFDTFRNTDIGDPSNNFVTVCTAGTPADLQWPPPRLASSPQLRVNLKDGKQHTSEIRFDPPALTVFLDGARVLATAVDLSTIADDTGSAWLGFTASTGGGFENHDILSWSFERGSATSAISFLKTACLPGKNLCTPEQASVEQSRADVFHIVLPGNVQWGASIPNPDGRRVTILNGRGSVCRDVASRGAQGCAGPSAIMQRNAGGRTLFGVGLSGNTGDGDTEANEGYFEFDVRLE